MTTTELIKILKDNEYGGISRKPRELSLTINGKYMPNPQITLSSTGDGVCGPEIDLDVDGEFYEEQEPKSEWEQDHAILKAYSDGANEVLDKIRAEIEELYSYVEFDEDLKTSFNMVRLEEVQRVIDKYKAECVPQESEA